MTSTTVEHLPGCRVVTGRADRELCLFCRTREALPDIDADRINGFRTMAVAVVDDMLEAATDMASRHVHQLDGLKAEVERLEAENHRLTWTVVRGLHDTAAEACAILEKATGNDIHDVVEAAKNAAELIATLRHRIDEAQKQMTAIAADAAPKFFEGGDRPALAAVEPLPVQAGPWVITRKDAHGRRFWGPAQMGEAAWVADVAGAYQYADAPTAERRKPRGSRVVTIADARELIEAEKVVTLAPVEPTGPEAA